MVKKQLSGRVFSQQHYGARIMMLDDEMINMEIIQIHLEEAGYNNFVLLDNPVIALEKMAEVTPDILLLDLQMPEISGFEILEKMRADDELKHIPVLILTSSTEPENKLKALEIGATDFLSKPVDPSELILRIRNTLTVKAYHDQLAYYDSVTGLPNRRLFLDRAEWVINNSIRESITAAILHITFDQLKQINGALGPAVGELVACEVADRLNEILRSNDIIVMHNEHGLEQTLAYVGIGEFSIILPRISQSEDAAIVAQRILDAHEEIFEVEGNKILLHPSIGVSLTPEDSTKADELFAFAVSAANDAQKLGKNNYLYHSSEVNEKAIERLKIVGHLRKALENNELLIHYQPKVDPITETVVGMEALSRWKSPELGMVGPNIYIPIAEEMGLIHKIGEWTLNEACRQVKSWQDEGLDGLAVSVNVSGDQFRQANFPIVVYNALKKSGLNPRCLVLELTESMVMGHPDEAIKKLKMLKSIGLSLSIDDFGTGYSSLSYLTKYRVDELKIDRSFIINIDNNDDDKAIVKAIIAMSQSLGLKVVAEGIETDAQLSVLKSLGCNEIQGYFFSKPLPKEDLPAYVNLMRQSQKKQSNL